MNSKRFALDVCVKLFFFSDINNFCFLKPAEYTGKCLPPRDHGPLRLLIVPLPCFLPFLHLLSPLYLKVCCLLQVTCFSILLVLLVVIFTKKCGAGDVARRVKALATKPGSGWIPRTHLVERED